MRLSNLSGMSCTQLALFTFVCMLFHFGVDSQACIQTHYTFGDQTSIDSFASHNPGCTVITGSVTISENKPGAIQNLNGLAGLQVVRGNLNIHHTLHLSSLSGLQNLDSVYGNVSLDELSVLDNIDALSGIRFIGQELSVNQCEALDTLPLFSDLTSLSSLSLTQLPVRNLTAFSLLKRLGVLRVVNCNQLLRLEGLEALDTISESIVINSNALLESLAGLQPGFSDSIRTIYIQSNPQLTVCESEFICHSVQQTRLTILVDNNGVGCENIFTLTAACGLDCPANLFFNNQEEINRFPEWLPQCHQVVGGVWIGDDSSGPIYNLDSLYPLQSIGGALEIWLNPRLTSISGLHQLTNLGGDLLIQRNDSLIDLQGLEKLDKLNRVNITNNKRLRDLQGLNGIKTIETIEVDYVEHLAGLDSLQFVKGDFIIEGQRLKSVGGLEHLTTVEGMMQIIFADSLRNVSGLQHLEHVGSLHLSRTGLEHLNALSGLLRVDSLLRINSNDRLQSIAGISQLSQLDGSIVISNNETLLELMSLNGQNVIKGDLIITGNHQLLTLQEFSIIDSIYGDVGINNAPLTDLAGLNNLRFVGGNLGLSGSGLLELSGLDSLKTVGGNVSISSCPVLTDMSALDHLDSVNGDFILRQTGLKEITDLHGVNYIGGTLEIRQNQDLLSITGFDALRSAGGVWLDDNSKLQHADGLSGLQDLRGDFWINYNSRLKHLPFLNGLRFVTGDVRIERSPDLSNLYGLDSLTEIHGKLHLYALGIDSLSGLDQLKWCAGGLTLQSLWIENVQPLHQLEAIGGPLMILGNGFLKSISHLEQLDPESIIGDSGGPDVTIVNNPFLGECASTPLCTIVENAGRNVFIENNAEGCNNAFDIRTKCALPYSCLSDGIVFRRQTQIDSFPILYPGCTFIQGGVRIEEDEEGNILTLDSLNGVQFLGGELRISGNEQLSSLQGLDSLRQIGGGIRIQNNRTLSDIEGLNEVDPYSLRWTSVSGYELWLTGNTTLSECASTLVCSLLTIPDAAYVIQGNQPECSHPDSVHLRCDFPKQCFLDTITHQSIIDEFPVRYPSCTELLGDLILRPTDQSAVYVSHLDGLHQLRSVRGSIEIYNADALLDLNGLEQITAIDGSITLYGNNNLASLDGLRNIDPETVKPVDGKALTIENNPLISNCALENICHVLQEHEASSSLWNNDSGCDYIGEVLSICIVGLVDQANPGNIQVYPNPTTGSFNVIMPNGIDDLQGKIRVYNSTGQFVPVSVWGTQIQIPFASAGMYTLIVNEDSTRWSMVRILMIQ